jgi:hypothetical protein
MVPPAVPLALLATLVSCRLALAATGVGTVTVPGGVGSGVVLVPAAVFVTTPVLAVTVALTTMVRVWPSARLLVVMRLVVASDQHDRAVLLLSWRRCGSGRRSARR